MLFRDTQLLIDIGIGGRMSNVYCFEDSIHLTKELIRKEDGFSIPEMVDDDLMKGGSQRQKQEKWNAMHLKHRILTEQLPSNPQDTPIIMDLGSSLFRMGYGHISEPQLVFQPFIGKMRGKKQLWIGHDLTLDVFSKFLVRQPFTGEILHGMERLECLLDYTFAKLGITDDHVSPIVATECVANPKFSRRLVAELLFETYGAPSVCFGVDALFSAYYDSVHHQKNEDIFDYGLVIRGGYHKTHVIPVIKKIFDLKNSRRIPIGGYHQTLFTEKLFVLKYPQLKHLLGIPRMEELKRKFGYMSNNYIDELNRFASDPNFFSSKTQILQLPFIPTVVKEKPTEDLEEKRKKRKETIEKMQKLLKEKQKKMREKMENDLKLYLEVEEMQHTNPNLFEKKLKEFEMDVEDLKEQIKILKRKTDDKRRERNKEKRRKSKAKEKKLESEKLKSERPEEYLKQLVERKNELESLISSVSKKHKSSRSSGRAGSRPTLSSRSRLKALASAIDPDEEDHFGMNDEDWEIYREMKMSEDENNLPSLKLELEDVIDEIESLEVTIFNQKMITDIEHHVLEEYDCVFAYTRKRNKFLNRSNEAELYQLRATVERCRIPELIWQPQMLGEKTCGLKEVLNHVVNAYPTDIVEKIMQNVYITGGSFGFPGSMERIRAEIQMLVPMGTNINIRQAQDDLDAWKGMQQFATQPERLQQASITKKEYDEYGPDYLKVFHLSNPNFE